MQVPYVSRRVHIAAVGFEVDRVVEPIIQMRGEFAILFANLEGEDLAKAFREQVLARLRASRIQTLVVRAPIFDLYATTQAILQAIRDHREDRVSVNVSSGSKVQALSGYIATSLARSEGIPAEAYYAEPQKYLADARRAPLAWISFRVRCPEPVASNTDWPVPCRLGMSE